MAKGSKTVKGKQTFTWNDPPTWIESFGGTKVGPLDGFGDPAEDGADIVILDYPPDLDIPAHHHLSDYCSIIVDGSMQVNRTWYATGTIRLVKATTVYSGKVGPHGCTVIEVFAHRSGTTVIPVDPALRAIVEAQQAADRDARASGTVRVKSQNA